MAVCAICINENGRKCLSITLMLLNLINAAMNFLLMLAGLALVILFHQQKNMLKDVPHKKLSFFIIFTGITMIILHPIGVKLSFDCGTLRTRNRWRKFMFIYAFLALMAAVNFAVLSIYCSIAIPQITKSYEKGFLDLMKNYNTDKSIRFKVDSLQAKYMCCGSSGFKDWHSIPWHTYPSTKPELTDMNEKFLTFERGQRVPASCCDISKPGPCIHDNVGYMHPGYKKDDGHSLYQKGCGQTVIADIMKLIRVIALWILIPLWLEFVIVILLKYLHSSIRNAKDNGDEIGPGYGYIMEHCPCNCLSFIDCDITFKEKKTETEKY